jgi:hypothetical protein
MLMSVLSLTSCCRTEQALAPGREKKSGCKARCCRHYSGITGQLVGRLVLVVASHEAFGHLYKTPLPRLQRASLRPDASLPPAYLFQVACTWTLLKDPWRPLHLDTSSMLDTLVRMFRSSPGKWSEGLSYFSQKLVIIGGTAETARRASASAWNGFIDCLYPLWK